MHDPDHSTSSQAEALAQAWVTIELFEAHPQLRAFARERALVWLRVESGAPFDFGASQHPVSPAAPAAVAAVPAPVPAPAPMPTPAAAAAPTPTPTPTAVAPTTPNLRVVEVPPVVDAPPAATPALEPRRDTRPGTRRARARAARSRAARGRRSSESSDESSSSWKHVAIFLGLALVWGTSFMFIKYGLRGFTPATLVCIQSIIATVVLWTFIRGAERRGTAGARMHGRLSRLDIAWLAALAPAGYWAIVWGEQYIDSGVAAILTATEPLWTLVILRLVVGRADWNRVRLLGMIIGLAGVALLGYGQGTLTGGVQAIGLAALLVSALLYSGLAVYVSRELSHVWYIRTAAWSVTLLMLVSLPFAIADVASIEWRLDSVLAVIALGVFDSALGYLLFYRLVRDTGPTRAAQVNYLLPVIAVLAGSMFLGEEAAAISIVAMVLILIGVWFGSKGEDEIIVATPASVPDEDSLLEPVRDAGGEAHARRAA